jgi:hypothetical protein
MPIPVIFIQPLITLLQVLIQYLETLQSEEYQGPLTPTTSATLDFNLDLEQGSPPSYSPASTSNRCAYCRRPQVPCVNFPLHRHCTFHFTRICEHSR